MTQTFPCPYCGQPNSTGEPCTPACAPRCPACGSSTLAQARSPTPAASGLVVYVVCGAQGCPQRRVVFVTDWDEEQARRAQAGPRQEAPHDGWGRRPVTTAIVREASPPPGITPNPGG